MNCISTLLFSASLYRASGYFGGGISFRGSRYACFSPHISFHLYLKRLVNVFLRTLLKPFSHAMCMFRAISIALEISLGVICNLVGTPKISTGREGSHYKSRVRGVIPPHTLHFKSLVLTRSRVSLHLQCMQVRNGFSSFGRRNCWYRLIITPESFGPYSSDPLQ